MTTAEEREEMRWRAMERAAAGFDAPAIANAMGVGEKAVLKLLGRHLSLTSRAAIRADVWGKWRAEGMTFRDIAARSGVTVGAVWKSLKRVKQLSE